MLACEYDNGWRRIIIVSIPIYDKTMRRVSAITIWQYNKIQTLALALEVSGYYINKRSLTRAIKHNHINEDDARRLLYWIKRR